jgi:hypothetical protein
MKTLVLVLTILLGSTLTAMEQKDTPSENRKIPNLMPFCLQFIAKTLDEKPDSSDQLEELLAKAMQIPSNRGGLGLLSSSSSWSKLAEQIASLPKGSLLLKLFEQAGQKYGKDISPLWDRLNALPVESLTPAIACKLLERLRQENERLKKEAYRNAYRDYYTGDYRH